MQNHQKQWTIIFQNNSTTIKFYKLKRICERQVWKSVAWQNLTKTNSYAATMVITGNVSRKSKTALHIWVKVLSHTSKAKTLQSSTSKNHFSFNKRKLTVHAKVQSILTDPKDYGVVLIVPCLLCMYLTKKIILFY